MLTLPTHAHPRSTLGLLLKFSLQILMQSETKSLEIAVTVLMIKQVF